MGAAQSPVDLERHDLVAGGEATYFMTGPDGSRSRGWWRVERVDPPRSLVFTDGFAREDGSPDHDMPTTAVRVRLDEHQAATRMELRFGFESADHMEQLERWGAFEVFPQSVAQMDAVLADDTTIG